MPPKIEFTDKKGEITGSLMNMKEYLQGRRKFVLSYWAGTKLGKTFLALTAPPPLFLLSFEPEGAYWAIQKALNLGIVKEDQLFVDEVIRSALDGEVSVYRTADDEQYIYEYVQELVSNVCSQNSEGTLILDTATTWNSTMQEVEMLSVVKLRKNQGKELYRFDYGVANKAMKKFVDSIRSTGLNCVLIHHDEPVYNEKGNETKRRRYSGNKKLPDWVDIQGKLHGEINGEGKMTRTFTIEECRLEADNKGLELDDEDAQGDGYPFLTIPYIVSEAGKPQETE